MALSNTQFDQIMRHYDAIQLRQQRDLDARRDEVYAAIPRMQELDEQAASLSLQKAALLLDAEQKPDADDLSSSLEAIQAERISLLEKNGWPADYLERRFDCPICRDTGFVGQEKCRCFLQKEMTLLQEQSQIENLFREENFSAFSLSYYDKEPKAKGEPSPREDAIYAKKTAEQFVENFSSPTAKKNLCFYGNVGVGKTFLTHCIAGALLDKGVSVLYQPSYELFDKLGKYTFSSDVSFRDIHDALFSCDLLIIDDLGTELTNAFVASQLFQIMNERDLQHKATILSTNIPPEDFADTFSERVSSRLLGSYQLVRLSGTDIRILKKLEEGEKA